MTDSNMVKNETPGLGSVSVTQQSITAQESSSETELAGSTSEPWLEARAWRAKHNSWGERGIEQYKKSMFISQGRMKQEGVSEEIMHEGWEGDMWNRGKSSRASVMS